MKSIHQNLLRRAETLGSRNYATLSRVMFTVAMAAGVCGAALEPGNDDGEPGNDDSGSGGPERNEDRRRGCVWRRDGAGSIRYDGEHRGRGTGSGKSGTVETHQEGGKRRKWSVRRIWNQSEPKCISGKY